MEYKVGDKVLIKGEVVEVAKDVTYPIGVRLRCATVPMLFTEEELKLSTKTYENGVSEGRREAWELSSRFSVSEEHGGFNDEEFVKIFGTSILEDVFKCYTYEEALAKIEAYEKEKSEIKVGDVIKYANNLCVVVSVFSSTVNALYEDGSTINMFISECKKTGKHIDIESLLRQIGE